MIVTQNLIEKIFGNKVTVVIGLRPQNGTIFQKNVLQKVQNITNKIQNSPLSVRTNITSLTSKKTKNIDKIFEPQKSLRNVDFSGFYFVLVAGSSQLSNLFFEDYYSILALAS